MSMQSAASPAVTFLGPPKRTALAHIPGDEGWPIVGRTLAILADPKGEVERMSAKYGLVYRSRVLGETSITAYEAVFRGHVCREGDNRNVLAGLGLPNPPRCFDAVHFRHL